MKYYVFGTTVEGKHSLSAINKGAVSGVVVGTTGQCYVFPTRDKNNKPLSLREIKNNVEDFLNTARKWPMLKFHVTNIAANMKPHSDEDIAPMFAHAPPNCVLPLRWKRILNDDSFTYAYL